MAIILSRAVGVDTTANQPAAATANRLYVHTTPGSKLYLPEIDDGAAWQPWRNNFLIVIFDPDGTVIGARTFVPNNTVTYQSLGGANQLGKLVMDFTRFREARLYVRANVAVANNGIKLKVRDLTNNQDIGAIANLTTNAWTDYLGAWTALNAATYGGDAYFEVQGLSNAVAVTDAADLGTISLELR